MEINSLDNFTKAMRADWGPLCSELVESSRLLLETLATSPTHEEWLSTLHKEASPYTELYRDPQHGFVLLSHTETAGLYRPPHDHGRAWVIYAVQQGEIEMGTYARVADPDGQVRLVKRNTTVVRPGQGMVYLPGDIHDTRCISGPALLFRFTERDLKKEDKEEHRVTRYVEQNGIWTGGLP
ncbi:putative metal-dependent enzyme (double-stranded beta helix superfamily) [Oxalobacteraceae bacterium GrIS 2.11]